VILDVSAIDWARGLLEAERRVVAPPVANAIFAFASPHSKLALYLLLSWLEGSCRGESWPSDIEKPGRYSIDGLIARRAAVVGVERKP